MAESHVYDGSALGRVRRQSAELTETAELGQIGSGTVVFDDTAGTQEIIGQKDYAAREDDADPAEIFGGFVGDCRYYRGAESVGMGREIEIAVEDLNATLGFRLIGSDGNRRRFETVAQRGAWLLGSPYLAGLVWDEGLVNFPDTPMDKADYTNQSPRDVLSDMVLAAGGYNFFVYRDDSTGHPSLFFDNPNTSGAYTSDVRVSNELGDVDASTYPPFKDARLTRSPALVWSKLAYHYAKGTVVRERPATAAAFNGERSGNVSNANVKTAAQAEAQADNQLEQVSTEEDVLDVTIQVPATNVNDVRAGQRIQVRFSHLTPEGYAEWTWVRVLARTVKSVSPALYDLRLKLSPQEGFTEPPPPPPPAVMVQCKSTFSAAETTVTMDSPVTVGNLLVSRLITRNSETIPSMVDASWTLLASGAATGAGGNTHGAVAMYGKIATSTSPTIGREATANQMQMTVCEIAGKGLDDITAVSRTHNGGGVCNMGSGSGSVGLWVIAIPRGTDQARNGYDISPSAGWTVEKNQDIDNGAACAAAPPDPWWWAAKIEGQSTVNISATLAVHPGTGPCAGQILLQWCAAAIFV